MYNQGHAEIQNDIVYLQQIRHCIRAFILHGEGLGPFAEIICDYQDVTVTIWSWVAGVQNIHRYAIPTMTSRNISQGMMASHRRFSLDASNTLCQPFLDIFRHARPVEPMCYTGQCPVPAQMAAKQGGMVSQEELFPGRT